MITPKTIWNLRQNKPTLIVKDLVGKTCDEHTIYTVLLERGVFKWFAVRRKLIKLKEIWKVRLNDRDAAWRDATTARDRMYLKGYRAGLRECIAEVRRLCHDKRWQAPDNDQLAQRWLRAMEVELKTTIMKDITEVILENHNLVISSDKSLPSKIS